MTRNTTKVQHFIPRFLLNNFCDSAGKLHMFDMKTRRRSRQATHTVAFAKNLYTLKGQSEPDALETLFARLESEVAPIVRKIVQQRSVTDLAKNERLALSVFVGFQLLRVYRVRAHFEAFKGERTRLSLTHEAVRVRVIRGPEDARLAHVALLSAAITEVATRINAAVVKILVASSPTVFAISDNPVIVYSSVTAAQVGPATRYVMQTFAAADVLDMRRHLLDRLDEPGVEIYLPLSPCICLFFCTPRTAAMVADKTAVLQLNDAETRTLNMLQAVASRRFLYADRDVFDDTVRLLDAFADEQAVEELLYDMLWNKHFVVCRSADRENARSAVDPTA